jgi:hypothetical protein
MNYNDLVPVYSVSNDAEAEIIKNQLEAEGIRSFVDGAQQAGLAGLGTLEVKVLVAAQDADRARRVLKEQGRELAPEDEG